MFTYYGRDRETQVTARQARATLGSFDREYSFITIGLIVSAQVGLPLGETKNIQMAFFPHLLFCFVTQAQGPDTGLLLILLYCKAIDVGLGLHNVTRFNKTDQRSKSPAASLTFDLVTSF